MSSSSVDTVLDKSTVLLWLEAYNENRMPQLEISHLRHQIVFAFNCDLGKCFLETKLLSASSETKRMILDEVIPELNNVVDRQNGKDSFLLLLSLLSTQDEEYFYLRLAGHLRGLLTLSYSVKVIKEIFKTVPDKQRMTMLRSLKGHYLSISCDYLAGSFLNTELVKTVDSDIMIDITSEIAEDVVRCCSTYRGAAIVKRIYQYRRRYKDNMIQSNISKLYDLIISNFSRLVNNHYATILLKYVHKDGDQVRSTEALCDCLDSCLNHPCGVDKIIYFYRMSTVTFYRLRIVRSICLVLTGLNETDFIALFNESHCTIRAGIFKVLAKEHISSEIIMLLSEVFQPYKSRLADNEIAREIMNDLGIWDPNISSAFP